MQEIKVGNVMITCGEGLVTFDDPLRESPLQLKYDDLPLLLDLLDSVEWERRRAFRVPVWGAHELSAVVEHHGQAHTADAVDISSAGVLLELGERGTRDLSVDDVVSVTLQWRDVRTTLSGVVHRCDGQRYGILFPSVLRRENVASHLLLRWIVNQLESQWLSRQIGVRD
jgi:hypothetical protein